jgi:hypothetical protein
MSLLYLLTESDADDLFYTACAEQITGRTFEIQSWRFRRNSGCDEVKKMLPFMLQQLAAFEHTDDVFFIVGLDNDRCPHFSNEALRGKQRTRLTAAEQTKENLHQLILASVKARFGQDIKKWPVLGAIAVPIEMLESWLLLIHHGGHATGLPRFPLQKSPLAQLYYNPEPVPPQLKDLAWEGVTEGGTNDIQDWSLNLVMTKLDAEELAKRSESFGDFKNWLDRWPKAS